MTVTFPRWIEELPDSEKTVARTRFLCRLAALHASPEGRLTTLSTMLGLHENSLATLIRQPNGLTPEMAVKLEELLGVDMFPRELLRPDLFARKA